MPEVVYERIFYQKDTEARAVVVDYSGPGLVEFRYGIAERMHGEPGVITYQRTIGEKCDGIPAVLRRALWRRLFQQARNDLNREIRIAVDPHYDLPEREVY